MNFLTDLLTGIHSRYLDVRCQLASLLSPRRKQEKKPSPTPPAPLPRATATGARILPSRVRQAGPAPESSPSSGRTPGDAPTRRAVLEPPCHAAAPIMSCNRVNQGDPQGGWVVSGPPSCLPLSESGCYCDCGIHAHFSSQKGKTGESLFFAGRRQNQGQSSHRTRTPHPQILFPFLLSPLPSSHLHRSQFVSLSTNPILFNPTSNPLRSRNALRSPSRRRQALRRQGRLGRPRRLDLGQGAPGPSCTCPLGAPKLSWRSLCFVRLAG